MRCASRSSDGNLIGRDTNVWMREGSQCGSNGEQSDVNLAKDGSGAKVA